MIKIKTFLTICVISFLVFLTRAEGNLILSTTSTETLGGLELLDGDLANYNRESDFSTLFLSESLFSANEDIDAVSILSNGNIILSTTSDAILGGLNFSGSDLVEYNPLTDMAALLFDGRLLGKHKRTNAAHVRENGNIVLSTTGNASLGSIRFGKDDLVEYNPTTDSAWVIFEGANIFDKNNENVDAIYLFDNGNALLSTTGSSSIGGVKFEDGDLFEYDPITNTASLYFDEDLMHCHDENIDAVYASYRTFPGGAVPEPATIMMLGLGAMLFICKKTNTKKQSD